MLISVSYIFRCSLFMYFRDCNIIWTISESQYLTFCGTAVKMRSLFSVFTACACHTSRSRYTTRCHAHQKLINFIYLCVLFTLCLNKSKKQKPFHFCSKSERHFSNFRYQGCTWWRLVPGGGGEREQILMASVCIIKHVQPAIRGEPIFESAPGKTL